MIEQLILARLAQDDGLTELLGLTEDGESRITPLYTTLETRAITVTVVPSSNDGVLSRSQLQLRIIEADAEVLAQISSRVIKLLVMEEQQPPITYTHDSMSGVVVLYRCTQNGGGQLADDSANIHQPLYFDLIWRYKENA